MNKPSTMRLAVALFPTLLTTISVAQTTPAAPPTTTKPAAAAQPWKKIPIPPLHPFKPAQPKRIELANGLIIFLQEDHELPFINGSILIRGGSRDEPDAKIGLVSLYGETWRTSGTATIDGDKLDDKLEAKAASIETAGGTASTSVNWSSLKGDFDTVFADDARSPAPSHLQGRKAPAGKGSGRNRHCTSQRRSQRYRNARGNQTRLRPAQSLCTSGRVRNRRISHTRRPKGMARQDCRPQQHHRRSLRRLRQRNHGSESFAQRSNHCLAAKISNPSKPHSPIQNKPSTSSRSQTSTNRTY